MHVRWPTWSTVCLAILTSAGLRCDPHDDCPRISAQEQRECERLRAPAQKARCLQAVRQRAQACRTR